MYLWTCPSRKLQKEWLQPIFLSASSQSNPRNDVQVFERLLKMNAEMQRIANEERAKLGKARGATVDRTLHCAWIEGHKPYHVANQCSTRIIKVYKSWYALLTYP